jgi:iron(III) transport system ATP-binding protein
MNVQHMTLDGAVALANAGPSNKAETGARHAASAFLRMEGLTKSFRTGGRAVVVVNDVTLDIAPSEFVCILGPSGCGKTTLLRLIAGFEKADSGIVRQAGRDITALPPEGRDFGIVFQSYALFPNRTVAQNIAYGLEATGVERSARSAKAMELLELVGLTDHATKYPSQISGGQQQRVALARALALSPGLLLLDEPLSALDANVRTALRDELRALQRRLGVTTLMVTHDQHEALSIADRLVIMNKGRIEQVGTPSAVYDRPVSLFAARFLGPLNTLPVDGSSGGSIFVDGLELKIDDAKPSPSRSACIRPAAVTVNAEGEQNAFAARVEEAVFLGDLTRITVSLPSPRRHLLQVDVHRARLVTEPRPGDAITVALPPRHLLLLPAEAQP